MREILFRGKRIDNGEWVEGYYAMMGKENLIRHYIVQNCALTGLFEDPEDNMYFNDVEIDPETLCQYTGLTDKNGNRIWENDIVDASEEWWSACGPAGHNSPIIKVEWLEGLTGFEPFANYDCDCGVYIDASGCEVIGNIFDNPELLKGEQGCRN